MQLLVQNVTGVISIINGIPTLGEHRIVRDRVFKLISAPPGLIIKSQPLSDGGQLRSFRVVRKNPWMDHRMIRAGKHMIGALSWLGLYVSDSGCRRHGVSRRSPRLRSHMAVLTGNSLLRRRRRLVLAEGFLKTESIEQIDVVAHTTKPGGNECKKFLRIGMDGPARFTPFGVDPVFVTVDHTPEFLIPVGP